MSTPETKEDTAGSDSRAPICSQLEPSPAVANMIDWCIRRIKGANLDMIKAASDMRSGMVAVGESMRELREDAKVSLRTIAKRIDVSPAFLSDLELGRRNWTPDLVRRFADAVGREYLSANAEVRHGGPDDTE